MKKKNMALAVLSVLLLMVGICYGAPTAVTAPKAIVISSGPSGGNWYAQGASFSDVLTRAGSKASSIPGGGSGNIIAVGDGKADLGFTNLASLIDARNGVSPFTKKYDNVCILMNLDAIPAYIIVPANSKVNSVKDLRGMTVAGPNPGTSSQFVVRDVLMAAGINEETDLKMKRASMTEAGEQFKDRLVDAYLITTGIGNSTIMDIATSMDVKFISLDDELIKKVMEINPGYTKCIIPANTFKGQTKEIVTVSSNSALIANKAMSDNDAYWITKSIVERFSDIVIANAWLKYVTVESMAEKVAIPHHPAALQFLNENIKK